MSAQHPFLFDFKQPIAGNQFLAGVQILGGRALMVQEDEQWWMYGVFPATLSEHGSTANECFLRFMEELKIVLYDFAAGAESFDQFQQEVTAFLKQTSPDADQWTAAQQKLRAGTVQPEKEAFLLSLPKESPEARGMSYLITRLDKPVNNRPVLFTPADNVVSSPAMAA